MGLRLGPTELAADPVGVGMSSNNHHQTSARVTIF
jgi:hypothetical protein